MVFSPAKTPAAVKFAATLDAQAPLQKLLATTLWEGTANLAADARETPGKGSYATMWRERYEKNLTPARRRENFRLFDSVFVITKGGPGDATNVLQLYAVKQGLEFFNIGYASAIANLTLVCIAVLAVGFVLLLRRTDRRIAERAFTALIRERPTA